MKKAEPFYYIVILAALFVVSGLIMFAQSLLTGSETVGTAVEPPSQDQEEALYDLWFSSTNLVDMDVDHGLTGILFSTGDNTVSLLDRERRLVWDKSFTTTPIQAKISSCGGYIVVGTEGGRLYLASSDQAHWWDSEGDPIDLIALSPTASWLAVARTRPEPELHYLELFNREGNLVWTLQTGPIVNLFVSSEYMEQANIFYTYLDEEGEPVVAAASLDGVELWAYPGQYLVGISKHGSRLAAVQGRRLYVYDSLGYLLWSADLPVETNKVLFNPQNFNRLLLYGSSEGAGENFYYYDLAEDLLWSTRIADGSLFAFTADGQYIVTSSWRHYKEDYTQMILLDREGKEINNWEVAMRIENLIVSGYPYLVVVGGEDGYIDLIDLKPLLDENNNGMQEYPLYNPVRTGLRADETMVVLYFTDERGHLVPVNRSVGQTDFPLNAALEELILGPARGSALYRTIPDKDISIEVDFQPQRGALILDLSPELVNLSGSAQSITALESLLLTVSSFSEVKEIILTENKKPVQVFGDGIALEQPLEPKSLEYPVYVPVASGNRYYLHVVEGARPGIAEPDLRNLVEQSLYSCRALSFVPADLNLLGVDVLEDQVQVNLGSSLAEVFPEDGSLREQQQALLVLDALFLTVFENSRTQRAVILIEGETWNPPAGFSSLTRFYRQPFFINPEQ